MEREGKNLALFLSSTGEEDIRKTTAPRALAQTMSFQQAFYSVNFSKDKKSRKKSDNLQKANIFDSIGRANSIGLEDHCENKNEPDIDLVTSQTH